MELCNINLCDKNKYMKTLDDISLLEQDWNGYNASPIKPLSINNAKSIIDIFKYQPEIFPTGRGTVQIEYDLRYQERRAYLEIEVYENKYTILIVYDNNYQSAFENTIPIEDIDRLKSIINSFFDIVQYMFGNDYFNK